MESVTQFINREIKRIEKSRRQFSRSLSEVETELSNILHPQIAGQGSNNNDFVPSIQNYLPDTDKIIVLREKIAQLRAVIAHQDINHDRLLKILDNDGNGVSKPGNPAAASIIGSEMVGLVINAEEAERHRLSRSIHDGPAQALSNFILRVEIATRWMDIDPEKGRSELKTLKEISAITLREVRDFIFSLRRGMLDELGLISSVKKYLDELNENNSANINYDLDGGSAPLDRTVELLVYRSVQEILADSLVRKGAAQIWVSISATASEIVLEIWDDAWTPEPSDRTDVKNRLQKLENRILEFGGCIQTNLKEKNGSTIIISIPTSTVISVEFIEKLV